MNINHIFLYNRKMIIVKKSQFFSLILSNLIENKFCDIICASIGPICEFVQRVLALQR